MKSYDTVTEALQGLKSKGYSIDFNIAFDKLICSKNEIELTPAAFEITEVHRFEGDTNPDDEDVVYAIESKDTCPDGSSGRACPDDPVGRGKIKGTITSAYGLYAESVSNEMIQKLTMHQ
jgi:hypothetical protein